MIKSVNTLYWTSFKNVFNCKTLGRSNYLVLNYSCYRSKATLSKKPLCSWYNEKDRLKKDYQLNWDDLVQRKDVKEVLNRTQVIDNEKDSAAIVEKILRYKKPIAVDMEGHHFDVVQLIQIKVSDENIYIFRPGVNRRLLVEGNLKNLLESSSILKIFHGGINDCIEVLKSGVKISNIYDTALAHNIIRYQTLGQSIHLAKGNMIGFNKICEVYNIPENPLKSIMKKSNMLWKKENVYQQPNLSSEMIAYSAFDVEPLHDLYEITNSMIEDDFKPLLKDLCENVLIRTIDPHLAKLKRLELMENERRNVFISGFTPKCDSINTSKGIRKADIYETLLEFEGLKQVYFSSTSAHVIMPSREAAVLLFNSLSKDINESKSIKKQFREKYGANTTVKLLVDSDPNEVAAANMENFSQLEANIEQVNRLRRLKNANYITDQSIIIKLMDMITKVHSPVVLDITSNEDLGVEMFVGMHPKMKFLLTPETINAGIGKVMASNEIVKIIPRIDTDQVSRALCLINTHGYKTANVFDLSCASKVIDYGVLGQSIFSSQMPSIKSIFERLGINSPTMMENYLYTYVHLVNHLLPETLQTFLAEKTSADVDIYSKTTLSDGRVAKRNVKLKYEGLCVHVVFDGVQKFLPEPNYDPIIMIKSLLNIILHKHKLKYDRIDVYDANQIVKGGNMTGIIQFCYPDDRSTFVRLSNEGALDYSNLLSLAQYQLENIDRNKLYQYLKEYGKDTVISAKPIKFETQEQVNFEVIREADLRTIMPFIIKNVQNLEKFKFTEMMNQYT